jgi:hypothetical protein
MQREAQSVIIAFGPAVLRLWLESHSQTPFIVRRQVEANLKTSLNITGCAQEIRIIHINFVGSGG